MLLRDNMGYAYKAGPRTLEGLKAFIDGGYAGTLPENTFEIPAKGAKVQFQSAAAKPKRDPDQAPDITYEAYGNTVFEPIKGEDGKVQNLKVRGDKPWFIMFYSPSCGHCNKFKPTWKEFYGKNNATINIGMLDCKGDETAKLCKQMNVRGYPTLTLFEGEHQYSFKGERSLEKLEEFAQGGYKNDGVEARKILEPPAQKERKERKDGKGDKKPSKPGSDEKKKAAMEKAKKDAAAKMAEKGKEAAGQKEPKAEQKEDL